MKITVFSKNMKSKEGRSFKVYLSRLVNKHTNEELPVRVAFSEGVTPPAECPCILTFERVDGHLSPRSYTTEKGEERTSYTLWLNAYDLSPEPYVDHSLDDYE